MKTAIIAGATGLIGSELLKILLDDLEYERIIVLTRRPFSTNHLKVTCVVAEFDNLPAHLGNLKATHAFCCLGTTIKKAGSKQAQYIIDHDYVVSFARACKTMGVSSFSVVSSLGANRSTHNFYLSTKGEMEEDVSRMNFPSLTIVRPSLLLGKRQEFRLAERIATVIMPLLSIILVGKLKKYRAIPAKSVAIAMNVVSKGEINGIRVVENDELLEIA